MLDSNFLSILTLFLFPFVILSILAFIHIIPRILDFLKLKKQRAEEFGENLTSGGVDEPHILRHLDPLEIEVLKSKHKTVNFWVSINHYTIPLNLLVIFLAIFFGIKNDLFTKDDDYSDLLVYPIAILYVQLLAIFTERRIYSDLRSPVFTVSGELIKVEKRRKKKNKKIFVIRGLEFDNDENSDVAHYWDKWFDGDKLHIEYSPFTRHIWKIEKV